MGATCPISLEMKFLLVVTPPPYSLQTHRYKYVINVKVY